MPQRQLNSLTLEMEHYAAQSVKLAHPHYRTEVMFRQLKKTLVATVIASLTLGSILPAFADSQIPCRTWAPLQEARSIGQEMQMGDYYVRQLRGSAPLINDLCWCNILTD
jgi:hypothetical protein